MLTYPRSGFHLMGVHFIPQRYQGYQKRRTARNHTKSYTSYIIKNSQETYASYKVIKWKMIKNSQKSYKIIHVVQSDQDTADSGGSNNSGHTIFSTVRNA